MVDRKVTKSRKDNNGNVIALCNPDFINVWSPRSVDDAIWDIESKIHSYYVQQPDTERVYVNVLDWPNGKFLRSPLGYDPKNNLRNIPDG